LEIRFEFLSFVCCCDFSLKPHAVCNGTVALMALEERYDVSLEDSLLRLGVLRGLGATLVLVDCANVDEESLVFAPRRPPPPPLDVDASEFDLLVERR